MSNDRIITTYVNSVGELNNDFKHQVKSLLSKVYKNHEEDELLWDLNTMLLDQDFNMMMLHNRVHVLGMCVYKWTRSIREGGFTRIDTLVVRESWKGYGSKLLDPHIDKGKILLECQVDNLEGWRFYEARDFKRTAYVYVR